MEISVGRLIAGKYELERLIGKGSMGEVWLARHASLEGSYAVKLIDVNVVPDGAGRFQMEAHIAAKLSKRTRHVVAVTDHGDEGDVAYLVMPLLEGQSLAERIAQAAPLPLAEVSTIVSQISRALTHAHAAGFIHRDVKPANIFLTRDEEGRVVAKLLDFGVARSLSPVRLKNPYTTAKDTTVGTPAYMSPEQTRALDTLDHRCDLWALAVVAYEALTGEMPFEGETLQDLVISIGIGRQIPIRTRRQDLPDAVVEFFDRSFADAIEDRFANAEESATAFSVVPVAAPARAMAASTPEAEITQAPRRVAAPRLAVGLAALLLVGAVVTIAGVLASRRDPRVVVATTPPAHESAPPPPIASATEVPLPEAIPVASSAPPPAAPAARREVPRAPVLPSSRPAPPASTPAPAPAPARSIDRGEVF